jgi:outer membrane protein assembly factor BamB
MRAVLRWIIVLLLPFVSRVDVAHSQPDWPTYRHDGLRTGLQPGGGALADVGFIPGLHCVWSFPPDGSGKCPLTPGPPSSEAAAFHASPIVVKGTVFIGDDNGVFYALDAATGALKWRYPKTGKLAGSCNPPNVGPNQSFGQYGIRSSATYATINGQDAVIFGAPDPDAEVGLGSARLFALDFSGNPIWEYDGVHAGSDVVARVNGCTTYDNSKSPNDPNNQKALNELHERIAYSSPLVLGNKVYVGVHDAGDNPLQQGRVSVVELSTGKHIQFSYVSTGTPGDTSRGGGVWNSLATDGTGVYFTTGNTQSSPYYSPSPTPNTPWNCPLPKSAEPNPNNGLSMLKVDKDNGKLAWPKPFQPVDFMHDGDPDWAAGATVMSTSCGEQIASVMKDGWSYGVNAADGSMRWQFPNTGLGSAFLSNYEHGDNGYRQPGAAWNDVLIVRTGGWALDDGYDKTKRGYGVLHALNVCATWPINYVRWIADLTNYSSAGENALGAPTVVGGFVYIGTDRGYLVVLGDPSVGGYTQGYLCSNLEIPGPNEFQCETNGYLPVPNVIPIGEPFQVPDGGDIAYLRKEPALSEDRVFVSTGNGHVYALATATLRIAAYQYIGGFPQSAEGIGPGSGPVYGQVIISRTAPAGGATVVLSSSDPAALTIPASVTIPQGQTTSSLFSVGDQYKSGPDENVLITANYGGVSASYPLLLYTAADVNQCNKCGSPARCCACAGGVWDGRYCE